VKANVKFRMLCLPVDCLFLLCSIEGQIFDDCHISATRITAPKSLKVVVKTKKNSSVGNERSFGS
jgi:hypothetical protein